LPTAKFVKAAFEARGVTDEVWSRLALFENRGGALEPAAGDARSCH